MLFLRQTVSPILIDLSHFAASVIGFLLLLLAAGLWRRRRGGRAGQFYRVGQGRAGPADWRARD